MSAMYRVLIISIMVIFPWAVIRIANLEPKIIYTLKIVNVADTVLLGMLLIPLLVVLVIKWLSEPINKLI